MQNFANAPQESRRTNARDAALLERRDRPRRGEERRDRNGETGIMMFDLDPRRLHDRIEIRCIDPTRRGRAFEQNDRAPCAREYDTRQIEGRELGERPFQNFRAKTDAGRRCRHEFWRQPAFDKRQTGGQRGFRRRSFIISGKKLQTEQQIVGVLGSVALSAAYERSVKAAAKSGSARDAGRNEV